MGAERPPLFGSDFSLRCRHAVDAFHSAIKCRANVQKSMTAVLIGGILRFVDRLNQTVFTHPPYNLFISTDTYSHRCIAKKRIDILNASIEITPPFPERFTYGMESTHVIQWWRVQRAWWMMLKHEKNKGLIFNTVIKLRTDIKHQLFPIRAVGTKMRGDWFAWGPRDAMDYHVSYLSTSYPRLVTYALHERERDVLQGDRVYWPLPYRNMLHHGKKGLSGHFWRWLEFPRKSDHVPYGFNQLRSEYQVLNHISKNLNNLSQLQVSCGRTEQNCITEKPFTLPPTIIPEAEKGILYHTLLGKYVFEDAMPSGYAIVGSSKKQSALIPYRKSWKCR